MAGIFIFSEDGALAGQLLAPALDMKKSLAQPIIAIALNEADAKALASLGADKVVVLAGKWVEGLADAIYSQAKAAEASVLLVGGTLRGKHVAAYVAAKLNAGMTTDAKALRIEGGKLLASRVLYAGLAVCEEEVTLPAVATIRARTFLPPPAAATVGVIETAIVESDTRVTIGEVTSISSEGIDITTANKLVAVGRGFREKEDLKLAEELGAVLKAEAGLHARCRGRLSMAPHQTLHRNQRTDRQAGAICRRGRVRTGPAHGWLPRVKGDRCGQQ